MTLKQDNLEKKKCFPIIKQLSKNESLYYCDLYEKDYYKFVYECRKKKR